MAKGQVRGNKEAKKPKATDKKLAGPKYLRPADVPQTAGKLPPQRPDSKAGKPPAQRPGQKPSGQKS